MEKNNVTYLFGAGVSAETIPIVNEFPSAIERVISLLVNIKFGNETPPNSNNKYQDILETLIIKLKNLEKETKSHMSIDTYAKKLYVLNYPNRDTIDNDYKDFKRVFTCLFMILTAYKGHVYDYSHNKRELNDYNKRYDAFIAGLINTSKNLPTQLNIVSWNYDLEFEKGLFQYRKNENGIGLKNIQNIYNFSPSNKTKPLDADYLNEFKFCKLNGNILLDYFSDSKGLEPIDNNFTEIIDQDLSSLNIEDLVKNVLAYYNNQHEETRIENLITFSWEKTPLIKETHSIAEKIFSKTNVLVIVGYSFPFFNRKIDKMLLESLKLDRNFKKIYIQDVGENTLQIKESVKSILNTNSDLLFEPLTNLGPNSPIYIPHSL